MVGAVVMNKRVGLSSCLRGCIQETRGIRGRVVKVVDFKPLAPHRCGFKSCQGLWILSCEEAIQLAYGTYVVLLGYPFVPEIMQGRAPEVFLHQYSWNVAI
jgi:hypothetical protein